MKTSHDHTTELTMTDNEAVIVSNYPREEEERSHALSLLMKGYTAYEVAHIMQRAVEWVQNIDWAHRYGF